MKPAVRRELAQAASLFWQRQPWRRLEDTHNFGFRDAATGQMACAVVLGNAGFQYGLTLYLGTQGFEVARQLAEDEMDREGLGYAVDFLSLSFTNADDVPKADRKRNYMIGEIESKGYVMLPAAMRKRPGLLAQLPDDADARFLVKALRAVTRLVSAGRLKPERLVSRARMPVFVLPPTQKDPILEEPAPAPKGLPDGARVAPLELSPGLRKKLAGKAGKGTLMATLTVMPAAVEGQQARMLLVYDPEADQVLDSHVFLGAGAVQEAGLRFLTLLGGQTVSTTQRQVPRPEEIWTDCLEFSRCLEKALTSAGIRILCLERIEELDRLREMLREHLDRRPPSPPAAARKKSQDSK
jgi:hypothetical protein